MNAHKYLEQCIKDQVDSEICLFNRPFREDVLEGGSKLPDHDDIEQVAILSSN